MNTYSPSREQGHRTPDQEQKADRGEESDTTRPILCPLDSLRCLALSMFPPGHPIANEQCQPHCHYEFGQEAVDVEEIAHGLHRNAG